MNRVLLIVLAVVVALSARCGAQVFHVEASRVAIVRDQPDSGSPEVLRLERGQRLNCVTPDQTDSYYSVFLPDGNTGWVSRYRVRLREGVAPEAPSQPAAPGLAEGMTAAEREWSAFHLRVGAPGGYDVLIRPGYVAGYDPRLKIPVWVQYRLTKARSQDNTFPRSNDFDEDSQIHPDGRATLDDYAEAAPEYVRGHMAPADDMRWDEAAEQRSNLLTNISPQIGATYNGSIWKTLENRVRQWAEVRGEVTVICGPVFEAAPSTTPIDDQPHTPRQVRYNVVGDHNVAVPTAFFKIVIDASDPDHPDVIAFLVRHMETEPDSDERRPETWLTSVDEIERLTGLDFLTGLPETVQREIEAVTLDALW